jgi:hypothetical protein
MHLQLRELPPVKPQQQQAALSSIYAAACGTTRMLPMHQQLA